MRIKIDICVIKATASGTCGRIKKKDYPLEIPGEVDLPTLNFVP